MSIRNLKGGVKDLIPVNNVLVSVFDKSGLDVFVQNLIDINPKVNFLSTGGTYKKIKDILGDYSNNLIEVAEYTNFPEMEGGLVKTLHPKIHAGLLGERNNPDHQKYLANELNGAFYIDMVAVNLYPFEDVINSQDSNFENARGNIDIGGPTMVRAAAKNFPGCAVICDPSDYNSIVDSIKKNNGSTSFDQRLQLAGKAFKIIKNYDKAISDYFEKNSSNSQDIKKLYKFTE